MVTTSMYNPGDEVIRGYKLTELQSAEAGLELWKAIDTAAGIQVALKAVDLSQGSSSLKEVRALRMVRNLNHPNLVPIFAARLLDDRSREVSLDEFETARNTGRAIQRLIIVMRSGGKSLATRLQEEKARTGGHCGLPLPELLRYMEGAAKGIDYLNRKDHGLGANDGSIIHCDIRPDTLMVVGGEVQISDCGLAVIMNPDPNRSLIGGTPAYCPPELTANKPVPATDLYSLAVTYHELRTGRLPFADKLSMVDMLLVHAEGKLDFSSPLLTDEERQILKIATARRPEDRFSSSTEFVKQLKRSVDPQLKSGKPPVSPPQDRIVGRNVAVDPNDPAGRRLPPGEFDTVLRDLLKPTEEPPATPAPRQPPRTPSAPVNLPSAAPPRPTPAAMPPLPRAPLPPQLEEVSEPDPTWYREVERVEKAEKAPKAPSPPSARMPAPAPAPARMPAPAPAPSFKREDGTIELQLPDVAAAPPGQAPKSAPLSQRSRAQVQRKASVRYYSVMHPQRMFPLMVVLSPEEIRKIVKKSVAQAVSSNFGVKTTSPVLIEPVIPGCDCYPPRISLTVDTSEPVSGRFWVVPQVVGTLEEARVLVSQDDRVLTEIPLEIKVRKPHLTWILAGLGLVAPYTSVALRSAKLDLESQRSSGFPIYEKALDFCLNYLQPEWIGGLFFVSAIAAYFWLRARQKDCFWEIRT